VKIRYLALILLSLLYAKGLATYEKILIIGAGGREHALAWKALQSTRVNKIFVAPGNGGTSLENGIVNVPIASTDVDALVSFASNNAIDLTIVGPETALAAGIVDAFSKKGLRCFGPSLQAAQLETSKVFSKEFMFRHKIPTARYKSFSDFEQSLNYVHQQPMPLVIKADGLAGGKGVIIAQTEGEAILALKQIMIDKNFGSAGEQVVIEEYLEGEEVSFIVITDGEHILPLETTQDHKRRNDHDQGLNTGGMGAYSPVSIVTPEMQKLILETIFLPTIKGMRKENSPYMGFLYAGLMLTADGPKVLEYNCRLGDPEAEPLLMRMQSDLIFLCEAALDHRLDQVSIQWDPRKAVSVVLVSGDYPAYCPGGDQITGFPNERLDFKIFHACTQHKEGRFITTGGRVLCATALGSDIQEAVQKVYELIRPIHWQGMHYRTDIGNRELERVTTPSRKREDF